MEVIENSNRDKMDRAKKRVKKLKGFYIHLAFYIGVNAFITISKVVNDISDGGTWNEAFFDFGTFAVWFFWGIGVVFHAIKVFSYNPLFSKEWEERQIQKYMDQEKKEAEKYR